MPVDNRDKKVNLGHARKRKRIEDKIKKPGSKCPRRCDKESDVVKYTSPYFPSNQINSTDTTQSSANAVTRLIVPSNPPSTVRAPTDIFNLPSSSRSAVESQIVTAIRFLTPVNIQVPPQQPNQNVVFKPS